MSPVEFLGHHDVELPDRFEHDDARLLRRIPKRE